MKFLALSLCYIIFIPITVSADQTTRLCKNSDGSMISQLQCPSSKKIRDGQFCVIQDRPLVYFNGCTKSIGEYGDTFYNPCLKHDFCYHHEPATNGLSKKDCDSQFYDDMLDVCNAKDSMKDFLSCSGVAWAFYRGVQVGGKKSWQCSNSKFDYSNLDKILENIN